jgi:integrase
MKGKRPHKVPLSDAAVAVLGRMTEVRTDNRVFPGLSERGMRRVFQEKLDKDPLTVHGLRSTFRDWVAEATNFQRELGEAALAHHVGGVEGAYQRGDLFEKRRKMMDAWAAYCGPAAGAKVVPMPKKKQAG